MTTTCSRVFAALLLLLVAAAPWRARAISAGQVDDFESGAVEGWEEGFLSPNPPINVASGGPAGAADNYLQNVSTGSAAAGGKQIMFNQLQWTGDYSAAGVASIELDVANFGGTALSIRVAFEGAAGQQYSATSGFALPADGVWRHATFQLDGAGLTQVAGAASLATVLGGVGTMRILSAAGGPAWNGDEIAAVLGVDNVTALGPPPPAPVPLLPGAALLLLAGLLAGLAAQRTARERTASC